MAATWDLFDPQNFFHSDSESDFEGFDSSEIEDASTRVRSKESELETLLGGETSDSDIDSVCASESESESESGSEGQESPGPAAIVSDEESDGETPRGIPGRQQQNNDRWTRTPAGGERESSRLDDYIFDESCGPQNIPPECVKPIHFFMLFFSIDLLNKICVESNRYAQQHYDNYMHKIAAGIQRSKTFDRLWKWWDQTQGMTVERVKAMLGLLLNMCLVWKPTMKDYWNQKDFHQRTPGFADVFSRDKFFFVLKFFHLNDNSQAKKRGEQGYDPLFKVRPLLKHLSRKFQFLYTCLQYISIDESLVGLKNRTELMQYLPNKKHHKWGIKLWVLCESATGYVYKLEVYCGKLYTTTRLTFGQSYDVVIRLMANLFHKGYILVVDNFYTSIPLAKSLYERGTYVIGTLRRNRKFIPGQILTAKLKEG